MLVVGINVVHYTLHLFYCIVVLFFVILLNTVNSFFNKIAVKLAFMCRAVSE
jgi:hypothetical protein